jgi:hypothetical protein
MAQAGIEPLLPDLPGAVRVSTARNPAGEKLWFFSNWSWATHNLKHLPIQGRDLLSGSAFTPEDTLTLDAWDVKILAQP